MNNGNYTLAQYLGLQADCITDSVWPYDVTIDSNSNGFIVIPESYTAGQIVVSAIAGQTSDNDGVGFIAQSCQIVANISVDTPNVITPYTTLDALDTDKTMADIANDLGLIKN